MPRIIHYLNFGLNIPNQYLEPFFLTSLFRVKPIPKFWGRELIIRPQKVLGNKYYLQSKCFDELNVSESETHGLTFPTIQKNIKFKEE